MLHDEEGKVILITGTSSGIGETCANYLSSLGHKVYGASRSNNTHGKFHWIRTDITKEDEVKSAVEYIIAREGRIDVLVNNSGINISGPVEEITSEEARRQFETNFFGALNMIRQVLPFMRNNSRGYIINISSIGGMIGLPFQGLYSASKFALEGVTESLRLELRKTGIQVTLIAPGDFCTPITQHRIINDSSRTSNNYGQSFTRTLKVIEKDECTGSDPIVIARLVSKLIHKDKVKVRYISGKPFEKLAVWLKRILPSEIFELVLVNKYQL